MEKEKRTRSKSKKREQNWIDNFIFLKTYYERKKENPDEEKPSTLKSFERYQNSSKNAGKLSQDRETKLNKIGFKWDDSVPPLKSGKEEATTPASSDDTCQDKATINSLKEEVVKYQNKQDELVAEITVLSKK